MEAAEQSRYAVVQGGHGADIDRLSTYRLGTPTRGTAPLDPPGRRSRGRRCHSGPRLCRLILVRQFDETRTGLVPVPVTDVDRAKSFYVEQVGFAADHNHQVDEALRFVQLTRRARPARS